MAGSWPRLGLEAAAALLLLAAGCAPAATPAAFSQTAQEGGRSATLSIAPYPPVTMRRSELRLTLRDEAGHPVSGATVQFDLDMPYCLEMPVNRPLAEEVEPGLYATPALFTMAGYWQARVEVSGAGDDQVFTFYLNVR